MIENDKGLDIGNNYATGINDLQFEKNIKEQRKKEEREQAALIKYEKKEEMRKKIAEYNAISVPIFKVKKELLLTTIVCFILGIFALISGFASCGLFTIISGIGTILIGQKIRISNMQPKLTNVILFNLSKSIKDLIDYKIPYEIFENEDKWLDMYTVLGMFIFMFFSSSNPLYGLVFILLIVCFVISFANRNLQNIYQHIKLIIPCCIIGLIVKMLFQYFYIAIVDVDLMNVILINLFAIISVFTEKLQIVNPNEYNKN